MSLALFRERIEQAAAGAADPTLRDHLKGCTECRAYYDELAQAARALGDDGGAAERDRLLSALPALPAERKPARWTVGVAAALAASLLLFIALARRTNDAEPGMRGADATAAPFSLRVYGKDAPGQKARLIADFPGSKEASVGLRAELQYFVQPPPVLDEVLVVETRGAMRTVRARLEGKPDSKSLQAVGEVFSAGSLGPGTADVCAVLAEGGREDASIDELSKASRTRSSVFCSTLVVTP